MPKTERIAIGRNDLYWLADGGPGAHGSAVRSAADVRSSLEASFSLDNASRGAMRFRQAQLGALHAILSREAAEETSPKTIVMPTGSGKTETMLAAFARAPSPTLVLVPTEALRVQIGHKFVTLGILPQCEMLLEPFLAPCVTLLAGAISSEAECDEIVSRSNVIVATAAALTVQSPELLQRLVGGMSRLFVDEAHHVAAATWSSIVRLFDEKPVVQFTATPYRRDEQRLSGEILFVYPLRLARRDGIFAPIDYLSVFDDTDNDRAIAEAAVTRLQEDRARGLDHLVMARVNTIGRADKLLALYRRLAPEFQPVSVHSRTKAVDRRSALTELRSRRSRVLICVDMFGEGFDMPSLKIAALHDPHRSLSVALQFIGRFTRTAQDQALGRAAVIVPRELYGVDERLAKLLGEDSDWNEVITDLTDIQVESQRARDRFELGFEPKDMPVALRSIRPKMSTVVYRSRALQWHPEGVVEYLGDRALLGENVIVNHEAKVLWFVAVDTVGVAWGKLPELEQTLYTLYVVHCDLSTNLLYVNSSPNEDSHDVLARAVGGAEVSLIEGNETFRVLHGLERRVMTTLGLLDAIQHDSRFTMHVGGDTTQGLGSSAAQKAKTNMFATGFLDGVKTSYGASRKGRIWSHAAATDVQAWIDWAVQVGRYVADETITFESVMSGFLIPERVIARPSLVPLGVEFASDTLQQTQTPVALIVDEREVPLLDVDLDVLERADCGPIVLCVIGETFEYRLEMTFGPSGVGFTALEDDAIVSVQGHDTTLSAYLGVVGVLVHFEKEALLNERGELLKPNRAAPRFPSESLDVVDWSGINIRKESQGPERDPTSVQYRAIELLTTETSWDIVIDDDGAGELADVVLLRSDEREVRMMLVHCKYSSADTPGARVADLYEVCGQAVKGKKAPGDLGDALRKLLRREKNRRARGRSGFLVGNRLALFQLANRSRFLEVHVDVLIVQPGLSKKKFNRELSELLANVDNYLRATSRSRLRVICSE